MHCRSITGLSDADVTQLQRVVDEQVQENLGMAMIYAVVAAAQEWLRDKVKCHGLRQQRFSVACDTRGSLIVVGRNFLHHVNVSGIALT